AEIQAFFNDGAGSLHTRSLKYGKLRNGSLVVVPSSLIKRSKSHFLTLPAGVDVILGLNGYVWVSKPVDMSAELAYQPEELYSNRNQPISEKERRLIARVCNCISILAKHGMIISDSMIVYTFDASMKFKEKEMFMHSQEIVDEARAINML
ncbi:exosome non-catalytic core subunit rrp4, partial [Blyttiomyces sp. JEL0837]